MGVLNSLFKKASDFGLLQPLTRRNQEHRISLYANDVALFIKSVEEDMNLTMGILNRFGDASGMYTNFQNSYVIPIRCEEPRLETVQDEESGPHVVGRKDWK